MLYILFFAWLVSTCHTPFFSHSKPYPRACSNAPLRYQEYPSVVQGFCPLCNMIVNFTSSSSWHRDNLLCPHCNSLPRERAALHVIQKLLPDYKSARVHESSPGLNGLSRFLSRNVQNYYPSQYLSHMGSQFGDSVNGSSLGFEHLPKVYHIDLMKQSFKSDYFHLVVAMDVFEHLTDPLQAMKEILRTLQPGGYFIGSVPLVMKQFRSYMRICLDFNNEIESFTCPKEIHGNPVSQEGSLMTVSWGYDIVDIIRHEFHALSCLFFRKDLPLNIGSSTAEYIEILVVQRKRVPYDGQTFEPGDRACRKVLAGSVYTAAGSDTAVFKR